MNNITFLGPVGATFSHDAYNILAKSFGAPEINNSSSVCIPAPSNGEILRMISDHKGYGAIAMETLAEGRVSEPLESFIALLSKWKTTEKSSFHIIGAVRMKLHFTLMARPGISIADVTKVIAHPKALGACKNNIVKLSSVSGTQSSVQTQSVQSNGEAAQMVATVDEYRTCAALGPVSAAQKFGLQTLNDAFEDGEAITTFFLIGPRSHSVSFGSSNRVLIVFKVLHEPGALVKALIPLNDEGLNMIQIHSMHAGNSTYHFAIELEVGENQRESYERALKKFEACVAECLVFGPFQVLST